MGIFLKNDYPGFADLFFFIYLPPLKAHCPDGEIGRHASLRGWFRLRCASSSLVLGTTSTQNPLIFSGFCYFQGKNRERIVYCDKTRGNGKIVRSLNSIKKSTEPSFEYHSYSNFGIFPVLFFEPPFFNSNVI